MQICIQSIHIYTHTLGRDKDTLTHIHSHTFACTKARTCNLVHMQLLVFFYPPFSDTNTNINFWNKQLSNYRMARVCVETTEKDVSQDCSGHPPLPLLLGLFFFFCNRFLPRNNISRTFCPQQPQMISSAFLFCVISQQGNKGTKTYYSLSLHHVQRLLRKSICHLSRKQHENKWRTDCD